MDEEHAEGTSKVGATMREGGREWEREGERKREIMLQSVGQHILLLVYNGIVLISIHMNFVLQLLFFKTAFHVVEGIIVSSLN